MTIEKRGDSYRVSQMVDGKRYRITLDHKPTKTEAMAIITDMLHNKSVHNMSMKNAFDGYIEAKSNILSPSTIRAYKAIMRGMSDGFMKLNINDVTRERLQAEVNAYAVSRKPKTVKNFALLITSVLNFYDIQVKTPTLPQAVKNKKYLPTPQDLKRIVEYYDGTQYKIYFWLAMYGLRRSEVLALQLSDLDGDKLTIDKALVQNDKNEWVIKSTKTTESERTIVINDTLADLIREQGYVFKGFPNLPYKKLRIAQKALGIPEFPLHAFRHFTASYLHKIGVPDKNIQNVLGWATDYVMKEVYQEAMDMEQSKKQISNEISSILS